MLEWLRFATTTSSRLLSEEFPHIKSRLPSLWTNSYFVATVSGATLAVVKRYIEAQKDRPLFFVSRKEKDINFTILLVEAFSW